MINNWEEYFCLAGNLDFGETWQKRKYSIILLVTESKNYFDRYYKLGPC